ncbi:hypothetical protein RhiirA5_420422 [Rhizophagus irregularis]|uniref:C2H2-type domain-containing protein n=1 Tax=Rhizophagus irregularis TaxID=588596 RepID=A0A2N0PG81_9GLOM|nr:hypothetical protein RhiirA5_420422 [Rhizophagus irregularis]
MPSATLSCTQLPNNFFCSTCGKGFKNSKGLTRHKIIVRKYNQNQELDELPFNIVAEFKQVLVSEIHKKLSLNFRSMGKKTISIPCPESLFFSIFTSNIHYYSKAKKISRCIFRGFNAYQELNPVSWNSSINSPSSQNQLDDDMDPLEQLLQSSIKNCKSNNQKKATTIFERRNFN